jgi:hypothetical protein
VVELVVMLIVDVTLVVDEIAAELGLNDALAPLGGFGAVRATDPANPLSGVMVTE